MSKRLAIFVFSALAALGLGTAASAQQPPQCPDPCTATFAMTSWSGMILVGDTILVTPTTHQDGTGALLGVIGGGTVCNPCVICGQRFRFEWNITSTKDLVYNNCGVLAQNGGSGLIHFYYTRTCGQAPLGFQIDYGDMSGPGCAGGQPEIPNPNYTANWALSCGNCQ
jgi:hypothetical protein